MKSDRRETSYIDLTFGILSMAVLLNLILSFMVGRAPDTLQRDFVLLRMDYAAYGGEPVTMPKLVNAADSQPWPWSATAESAAEDSAPAHYTLMAAGLPPGQWQIEADSALTLFSCTVETKRTSAAVPRGDFGPSETITTLETHD